MDIQAKSADEALQICRSLILKRQADLFRGQTHDWPKLLPSLLRQTGDQIISAHSKLNRFLTWAKTVPQMGVYSGFEPALTAIAQHYGVPTRFLDLTTAPGIARLFAKQSSAASKLRGMSVIYCLSAKDLNPDVGVRLLSIDVHNLWRLEAQKGLFLEFLDDQIGESIRNKSIRIHFPSEQLSDAEQLQLYPLRKSPLETVIDQWLYREEVKDLFESLGPVKYKQSIRRVTYPGAFKWREVPELDSAWIDHNDRWLIPNRESVDITSAPAEIVIPLVDLSEPHRAQQAIFALIKEAIQQQGESDRLISFKVNLSPAKDYLSYNASTLN